MIKLRLLFTLTTAAMLVAALFTVPTMTTSHAASKSMKQLLVGKAPLTISPAQRRAVLSVRKGALNFSCNVIFCACTGDVDCNDMFSTNVCGGRAICIDNVCYCDRR